MNWLSIIIIVYTSPCTCMIVVVVQLYMCIYILYSIATTWNNVFTDHELFISYIVLLQHGIMYLQIMNYLYLI